MCAFLRNFLWDPARDGDFFGKGISELYGYLFFAVVRPKLCYAVNSTGPCVFFSCAGDRIFQDFFAAIEGSVMIISF